MMEFQNGSDSGLSLMDSHTSRKKSEVLFTQEELKDLFVLREDTVCDTHDLIGCRCCLGGKMENERKTTNGACVFDGTVVRPITHSSSAPTT